MNLVTSFVITPTGKTELQNSQGELTADQRQILMLVDGKRTIKEISALVSSSDRLYLDELFEYLLLAGLVAEAGEILRDETPTMVLSAWQKNSGSQTIARERALLTENERRVRLEQDLCACQAQLGQTTEAFESLSNKYKRIKQQVLSYKHGMESKVIAQQAELDALLQQNTQSLAQRIRSENELKLLQVDFEQLVESMEKNSIEIQDAVKIRISEERKIAEEQERQKTEVADDMVAHNPRYQKIRELDFFRNFNNLELSELVVWAEWCIVSADECVLAEGEVGSAFYVVVSGKLVVLKEQKVLTILKQGMPFGEGFYLEYENMRRSASVVARTECELLRIDPVHLEEAEPAARMRIAEAFMRIQTKRLRAASQMIKNLLAHG
jgi:hypothetical protein